MRRVLVVLAMLGCARKPNLTSTSTPSPPSVAAVESPPAPVDESIGFRLGALVANPASDPEGKQRAALCAELGRANEPGAVELLELVLSQPADRQPAIVFREAITAAGMLGATATIDEILTAVFRVPDFATSKNVGERARFALAAIGPAAVVPLVEMLQGNNAEVEAIAAEMGHDRELIELIAMNVLPLVDTVPDRTAAPIREVLASAQCGRAPEGSLRFAAAAVALGRLTDTQAVAPLCACLSGTLTPDVGFHAAQALAFIGGDEATKCLVKLIATARYDRDAVQPGFEHELRWEAIRFAAIAGGSRSVPAIRAAVRKAKPAAVKRRAQDFTPMLDALADCGNAACAAKLTSDPSANAFAREAAAFELSRAQPQSVDAGIAIAEAFAIPDPDVRLSIAMLTRRVAPRGGCPRCADALRAVLVAEHGKMDMRMQAAVLEARATIAVVSAPGTNPFAMPNSH